MNVQEKTIEYGKNSQFHISINPNFWQLCKPFQQVSKDDFLSHRWQVKHAVYGFEAINTFLRSVASSDVVEQVLLGLRLAPMAVRLTPYILSKINWLNPIADPIRRQFIPLANEYEQDHPMLTLDSLGEQEDSPLPGLVHRYPNKALFLAQSHCPVYCRFCTRSYLVSQDTHTNKKVQYEKTIKHWKEIFKYIDSNREIEDLVVSEGDCYNLSPKMLEYIGNGLLEIPHLRRIRFATKGLAVDPTKILSDREWTNILTRIVDDARKLNKHVAVHTHFNHPNEISWITQSAAKVLFERGITVRNQSVLIRDVNDNFDTMATLIKMLGDMNIQPYYVYQHDMVRGVENLKTDLSTNVNLEKRIRGITAGFFTPTFVTDCPCGGGKRVSCSYEYYNRSSGVSVYIAPSIKSDRAFLYFDPLVSLAPDIRKAWLNPDEAQELCNEALSKVNCISSEWKNSYLNSIPSLVQLRN